MLCWAYSITPDLQCTVHIYIYICSCTCMYRHFYTYKCIRTCTQMQDTNAALPAVWKVRNCTYIVCSTFLFIMWLALPHFSQSLLPYGSTLAWQCASCLQRRPASRTSPSHSDTAPLLEGVHLKTSGGPLGQPWQTLQTGMGPQWRSGRSGIRKHEVNYQRRDDATY